MPTAIQSSFTNEEIVNLTGQFRLTAEASPDRAHSIPSALLLEDESCTAYIDRTSELFGAPPRLVAGSLFAKRYSFLTVIPALYAMTMYDKGMDVSAGNGHVESSLRDNGTWLPKLRLTDWRVITPTDADRRAFRDEVIRTIFAENISKVWRTVSRTAKTSAATLWENTAVNVYWLYEKKISEGASPSQLARIRDDYAYLLTAPAALFGEKTNPLAKFDSPKRPVPDSGQPIRIRRTCCLYYRTSDEPSYCSVCPKNNHAEAT
ncbi:IucA/IucC family C-terminal-domain containing protein [Paenibacillus thailandensis]|uniref:IucA/IucC family C-terminal-domain containing protein n=1 Tax=Paenibacillus thailandensis TaxID=393250 RepID=A0ABW5QWA9_9BACL